MQMTEALTRCHGVAWGWHWGRHWRCHPPCHPHIIPIICTSSPLFLDCQTHQGWHILSPHHLHIVLIICTSSTLSTHHCYHLHVVPKTWDDIGVKMCHPSVVHAIPILWGRHWGQQGLNGGEVILWIYSLKKYLSDVPIICQMSNSLTMEEVHKKGTWHNETQTIRRSILRPHMMIIKTPQNLHKICFWIAWLNFTDEV